MYTGDYEQISNCDGLLAENNSIFNQQQRGHRGSYQTACKYNPAVDREQLTIDDMPVLSMKQLQVKLRNS